MKFEDAKKYKWFYTSSGNLVVGGKSARQNDELLSKLKNSGKEHYVMHTSSPGSPFTIIVADLKKVTKSDLQETSIFTGCFSRAWKLGKKVAEVHLFKSSQVFKGKGMKSGTWAVSGKVKSIKVDLKLVLTRQNGVYRAVPEKSARKKDILLTICPGKIDKGKMLVKLATSLKDESLSKDELLSALPAGGVRIC